LPTTSATIQGVLLAGGAGRRFGGGKLLHPLADGTPIGVAAWRNLRAALPDSVVVVRMGDDALRQRFSADGAQVLVCEDAHQGMAHSLSHAIRTTSRAAGWVIALGDMPRVNPETIRTLAQRLLGGARIVLPTWHGERGHPVGFAARYRDELLSLAGDRGARSLLERNVADVEALELEDPGVLLDVDEVGDLEAAIRDPLKAVTRDS
jgi:molybdenum cofactor cytidylyltransferase